MTDRRLYIAFLALTLGLTGCWLRQREFRFPEHQVGPHEAIATQIEYPDVQTAIDPDLTECAPPRATENPRDLKALDMSLPEAMQQALSSSDVIRNLGGTVVSAPAGTNTMYNPALVETDPRSSVEAALSAFDAQVSSTLFWNKIDRGINQTFSGLFLPTLQQLQSNYLLEVSKIAATGSRFAVRNHVNYDRNMLPNPSLRYPSIWELDYEAEFRQPLLQGAGVEFNRIAGPNSTAGGANGVLLARINTDVSLADFEASVINLTRDVEQAYWDLYFAYRDLDAKIAGRDSALVTWQNIAERQRIGLRGGTPENESQLRSQYFLFQAAVDDALATLYKREESLRYMLGLPPNGPEIIRPSTEPTTAKIVFSWRPALQEAYLRRVELRRQKWEIKRTELELVAAKNFLKPRLDAVALYRFRGLGDTLMGPNGPSGYENAYSNMFDGDYQEWQMGVQFDMPIGFRREFAAMRNVELRLARHRAILDEQEFRISHDLSDAVRDAERAFQLMKTNLNRRVAAHDEVEALTARFEVGFEQLDVLLRAEQRLAESNSAYYRSLIDYSLAIRDVHMAKGSLLEYDGVSLAEGPWSSRAYLEALERSRHFTERVIDYGLTQPRPVSQGPYLQHLGAEAANLDGGAQYEPVATPAPSDMPTNPTGDAATGDAATGDAAMWGNPPLPPPPAK
jgi:outer membrane protein TolC